MTTDRAMDAFDALDRDIDKLLVRYRRARADRADRAVLLEACKTARKVISVACGETAPYIKPALTELDAAIAQAEEHS